MLLAFEALASKTNAYSKSAMRRPASKASNTPTTTIQQSNRDDPKPLQSANQEATQSRDGGSIRPVGGFLRRPLIKS